MRLSYQLSLKNIWLILWFPLSCREEWAQRFPSWCHDPRNGPFRSWRENESISRVSKHITQLNQRSQTYQNNLYQKKNNKWISKTNQYLCEYHHEYLWISPMSNFSFGAAQSYPSTSQSSAGPSRREHITWNLWKKIHRHPHNLKHL